MPASIKRDITILLIGALISTTTSVMTMALTNWTDKSKEEKGKIYQLNYELSKDIGRRIYATSQLLESLQGNDTVQINSDYNRLVEAKMQWNIQRLSYTALITENYGEDVAKEFVKKIHNPLVYLGNDLKSKKKIDSDNTIKSMRKRIEEVDFDSQVFINKLFALSK
jgi:hypothetical protein